MPMMFNHRFNLAIKLFLGQILPLTFVIKLKYVNIVNGVNRWANGHPTSIMCHLPTA